MNVIVFIRRHLGGRDGKHRAMVDLVQHYQASLPIWLHDDGFSCPPLMALHHDGHTSMANMMIPQETIFQTVMEKFIIDLSVKEIIFGIDCYTKPGQGTKYDDVLTVFWWQGEYANQNYGWRFGVVNYRPPPHKIIEPIDWTNTYWNDIMLKVVKDYYRGVLRTIAATAAKPGGQELIDNLRQALIESRDRIIRDQKPS